MVVGPKEEEYERIKIEHESDLHEKEAHKKRFFKKNVEWVQWIERRIDVLLNWGSSSCYEDQSEYLNGAASVNLEENQQEIGFLVNKYSF